jgi:hypothetical protein
VFSHKKKIEINKITSVNNKNNETMKNTINVNAVMVISKWCVIVLLVHNPSCYYYYSSFVYYV